MKIYDVIIIGGGPAGYTAALYSARAGLDTLLIEKTAPGGQMATTGAVDNYPGFDEGIIGFELAMKMKDGAERFGAKTEYGEVTGLLLDGKIKTVVSAGGEYRAKAVIIAGGADPRKLGVKGEEELLGQGVHYCAHCDGRFYKDGVVAVVGGGNSALENTVYLSRLAKEVYLIIRGDAPRALKIYTDKIPELKNVRVIKNTTVEEIEKLDSKILVKLASGAEGGELLLDGLFVSVGRTPATGLYRGLLSLDENSYIIADESTKTSVPGVFAAGDIRTKELRQIVTATADGAVAAYQAENYILSLKN